MWAVLLSVAYGSCIASPEQTLPRLEIGDPHQPLPAASTWGTGEHLAHRLRLRGPDGALVSTHRQTLGSYARLVPKDPLRLGTYMVEERGTTTPRVDACSLLGRRITRGGSHRGESRSCRPRPGRARCQR